MFKSIYCPWCSVVQMKMFNILLCSVHQGKSIYCPWCSVVQMKMFNILLCSVHQGRSTCHKLKFSNPFIFATRWSKFLKFQTYIIWCGRIHSLKYLRYAILSWDIRIRKSEFVAKIQFFFHIWLLMFGV